MTTNITHTNQRKNRAGLPPNEKLGHMNTNADVLQIFMAFNYRKFRGCAEPISLMKATSASGLSRRRNTGEIAPLPVDVP
ncbi:hypothetical protein N7G274_003705 [Stereocaulon virgatum]|uniref:Uncharacterized protein n=1 Tax=Stereocaulon virgatum TaxID=373712 RepID=A0ABR4AFC1_9LECA